MLLALINIIFLFAIYFTIQKHTNLYVQLYLQLNYTSIYTFYLQLNYTSIYTLKSLNHQFTITQIHNTVTIIINFIKSYRFSYTYFLIYTSLLSIIQQSSALARNLGKTYKCPTSPCTRKHILCKILLILHAHLTICSDIRLYSSTSIRNRRRDCLQNVFL